MTDEVARREQNIEIHWYLCARAARKFLRRGVDRADLEQVAAIGLIKAVDRYDPSTGTPFEAYAWVFILGELMHYVRDTERILRVPRRLRELERRWVVAERELLCLLGREPSDGEIASYVGARVDEQTEVRKYRNARTVLSMDSLQPGEYCAPSYTIDNQLDRLVLDEGLAHLSTLEREIIKDIYERDRPVSQIAARLGYSRRHVTRLHRGALKKLFPYARPQIA
ncbi:MAG: sigma-70 family RNA polymerase sigma factor [Candidatus Eremiobacteraeota bacterium]|nr:sigma-70 family RNA polymerase sigma factor [Candidatus Eremiobacteraeota bacterium]